MAPKTKTAPANGTKSAPKETAPKPSVSPAPANGAETPLSDAQGPLTKPDKAAYDAEQDKLRKEIEAQQAKLVRSRCAGSLHSVHGLTCLN